MREGAVGLLALVSVSALVALVVWLRGVSLTRDSYRVRVEFPSADGLDVGTVVTYRGVPVGRIERLEPGSNLVAVVVRISPASLRIPKRVEVEVDQTGLIGEAVLSIVPEGAIAGIERLPLPTDEGCSAARVLLCDGDRVAGNPPINYGSLIRAMVAVSELVTASDFQDRLDGLLDNVEATSREIRGLSRNGASLARSLERELRVFSATARSLTNTSETVGAIARSSAGEIAPTAAAIRGASNQTAATLGTLNGLLVNNRTSITTTLGSISRTSDSLREVFQEVAPLLRNFNESGVLTSLDALVNNAAAAIGDLRQLTGAASDPSMILNLQETLDSARTVLQNVEKITADLESLTGDEKFRESLRKIITTLGELLSSVEELDRQVAIAKHQAVEIQAAAIARGERPKPVNVP
jgi:phospholipid/cholesterol/gamma-HCH transport system substrate-binding protein